MEDAAGLLSDVVSSLDNLPSEVHFLCQEIGHLEARGYDYRNRGAARDSSIQKYGRPVSQGGMGLLVVNPKEESNILKIRNEFIKAEDLAREKVALAERGVNLLSRHLTKLTAQLETLTPNVPPLPTLPSYAPAQHAPTPATQYSQSYSTPTAASQQQYQSSYQAGAYGMGTSSTTAGASGAQGAYGYGTPIDKSKRPLGSTDLGSQPQIAANHQLQNAGHHAQPNYPYPSPVPQPSSASGSRVARPSRLNTVYPNNQSPHSHLSVGQMAQQQQLHLQQQAQRMHVQQQQQQQMVVQQQQQQIMQQQQQLQQQQQQLQSQQQSGNHLPNGHSSSHNKRRRISDGDADEDGADEEGADGEDTTPYCFCQRPSFGEMIGCDAPDCAIEWFHLSCVGLKSTPEGSWYCSNCAKRAHTGSTRGRNKK